MDYVSGGANTTLPLLLERYRTDKVSSFFSMFCKSVIHITDKTTIDVIQQLHKYSQSAQNKINLFSSHIDGSILLCSVSGCMIFPMRLVLFISTENWELYLHSIPTHTQITHTHTNTHSLTRNRMKNLATFSLSRHFHIIHYIVPPSLASKSL